MQKKVIRETQKKVIRETKSYKFNSDHEEFELMVT